MKEDNVFAVIHDNILIRHKYFGILPSSTVRFHKYNRQLEETRSPRGCRCNVLLSSMRCALSQNVSVYSETVRNFHHTFFLVKTQYCVNVPHQHFSIYSVIGAVFDIAMWYNKVFERFKVHATVILASSWPSATQ